MVRYLIQPEVSVWDPKLAETDPTHKRCLLNYMYPKYDDIW